MKRTFLIVFIVVVVFPVVFAVFTQRVQPYEIGVKQNRWGAAGILEEDFGTGFHLAIPGYHLWHFLPRQTHFIHFTSDQSASGREFDIWTTPFGFRTKDANNVSIELSVAYRVIPEEAHQIVANGLKGAYRGRVKLTVEGELRSELAQLTSEDWQITDKRIELVDKILPSLNLKLAKYHCRAETILIRAIAFQTDYESKLQEKQYLRQQGLLDNALTLQANEEKAVNEKEKQIAAAELAANQDWEKKLQEERSRYEVLIAQIDADASVYASRTRAEGAALKKIHEATGQLALDKAEALKKELRTDALNSEGGRILLALDAAQNLSIPSVTLNSDDPAVPTVLDLDALTRMLVGETSREE